MMTNVLKSLTLLALSGAIVGAAQADLSNASFESAIGSPVNNWFFFNNGFREPVNARTGEYTAKFFGQFTGGTSVSGCFQDFAISPGQSAYASGFGMNWVNDLMSGDNFAIIKLIYRDSSNNDLVAVESARITAATAVNKWQALSAALGPAPANVDHGSVFLLFIQPDSTPFAGGSAWFDDMSLIVNSGRTVSGTVNFGLSPSPARATFEFRNPGTLNVVASVNGELDADGHFTIAAPEPYGSYNLAVKGTHWLRDATVVNTGSGDVTGVSLAPINGDCDGNNYINTDDYLLLSDSFDLGLSDEGFNPMADLDENDYVNTDDYLILSNNFDTIGDD